MKSLVLKRLLKKFDDMTKKKSALVSRIWDSIMEEGMEKGQYLKAVTTAENCLKEGLSIALTARVTQLSEEEVHAIAERLNLKS